MNINLNNNDEIDQNDIMEKTRSSTYLYAWGFGKYGQIGGKYINFSLDPIYIDFTSLHQEEEIYEINCGEFHNVILTTNSHVYTFGKNSFGQLGLGNTNYIYYPTLVKFPSEIHIKKLSLGGEHTLAKSDNGILFSFGLNIFGQLGTGDNSPRATPTQISIDSFDSDENIIDIAAGAQHSLILTNKNRIFSTGIGKFGALGLGISDNVNVFTLVENNEIYNKGSINKIVCGTYHSCCIMNNETLFALWGAGEALKYPEAIVYNINIIIQFDSSVNNGDDFQKTQIEDIKIGDDFIVILTKNNLLFSFGKNNVGQLGNGNKENSISPNRIKSKEKFKAVEVGSEHAIGITIDDKVYAWGSNEFGQCSCSEKTFYLVPTLIEDLTKYGIVKVASGGYHNTCLLSKQITRHVPNENEIKFEIFKDNLKTSKLSSTVKNDLPSILKKIKITEQLKSNVKQLEEKDKAIDIKIAKLVEKDKSFGVVTSKETLKMSRGFDNSFEIDLNEIEFDDREPEIGKGTFGEVRKGIWRGEDVAVKFLRAEMLSMQEGIIPFVEECNIMKNLRHPNILLYMGACTKGPEYFVVTEFCENGNLFELLHLNKTHKLYWEDLRRIALEIAYGVNYLHCFNPPILHRDLKSMNVLLDRNFQVKLADFGNTRYLDVTMTKQKGTFQWMAPEVIKSNSYSEKSDVYSFGIIMNELATRAPPYQGVEKREVARKVATDPNYRPSYGKRVPLDWVELMTRCYEQNEKKRPRFSEIIECLKKAKLSK